MGVEPHYHCIICGEPLAKWKNYTWHKIDMNGKTICYCDSCKERYEESLEDWGV